MASTWYWRAAVGASGVQELDRVGPPQDEHRHEGERHSRPWLTQRSPSFALVRLPDCLVVVCDALATHTADEHNRAMRARCTVVLPDQDAIDPLRLVLAYFAAGTAPELTTVAGRLHVVDGWDRQLPPLPAPAADRDPSSQVRVARREDFVAAVLALGAQPAALRRAGPGLVCLYSDWLTPGELGRVARVTVAGGPGLLPGTVPKVAGGRPDGTAPARLRMLLLVVTVCVSVLVMCWAGLSLLR